MSTVRKAHTVEILDRRLRDCESGPIDAMELIGIYDELSRVQRKWLLKAGELRDDRPVSRPLANAGQLDQRFARLAKLVDVALRIATAPPDEMSWLKNISVELEKRQPLAT